MVPLPSQSIVPIEDMHKAPVLQTHQLGIDFGGLTAVNNLNLAIGPTEICGLIGPNGAKMCFHFYLLERAVLPCEWESRGFRSSSLLYDRHELDSYAFSSSLNGGWSVVFTRGVVTSA